MQIDAPSPDTQNQYEGDAIGKREDQGEGIELRFNRGIAIHRADMLESPFEPQNERRWSASDRYACPRRSLPI